MFPYAAVVKSVLSSIVTHLMVS